jgi:putative salt-induced outer membrane protein YdiY
MKEPLKTAVPIIALLLACLGCSAQNQALQPDAIDFASPNYPADASPEPAAAPAASAPEAGPDAGPSPELLQDAEKAEEKKIWSGLVEVIATATGGNTKTRTMDARAEVNADWGGDRLKTYARVEWTETEDSQGDMDRSRNRQTAGAKYEHDISKRLYDFARQDFERDEFQDLRLRSTTTVGVGYKVLDEEKHKLDVEGGIGYERSDYYDDDTRDDLIGTLGEKWEWTISEAWSFMEALNLISNLLKLNDEFRTVFVAELRHKVSQNLFVSLGFEHRYNAEPARDDLGVRLKRQDWMAYLKLGYSF